MNEINISSMIYTNPVLPLNHVKVERDGEGCGRSVPSYKSWRGWNSNPLHNLMR
jgi:hypothetical protein